MLYQHYPVVVSVGSLTIGRWLYTTFDQWCVRLEELAGKSCRQLSFWDCDFVCRCDWKFVDLKSWYQLFWCGWYDKFGNFLTTGMSDLPRLFCWFGSLVPFAANWQVGFWSPTDISNLVSISWDPELTEAMLCIPFVPPVSYSHDTIPRHCIWHEPRLEKWMDGVAHCDHHL